MSGLTDGVRRFFSRFGKPEQLSDASTITVRSEVQVDATLASDASVDHRLTDLERQHLEMQARLRILEKGGNPRGIGRD